MTKACAYFLGEKYNILDVLNNDPYRLGYSICSSLAHKVILRAQLIENSDLSTRRNILPGELYSSLVRRGWTRIEASSSTYFDDHKLGLASISPIHAHEQGRRNRIFMRSVEPVLESIHEIAQNTGLTRRDLIRTECMLIGKNIFTVLADQMATLYQQKVILESRDDASASHWTEENVAENEWRQRLRTNSIATVEEMEASMAILDELSDLPKERDTLGALKRVIDEADAVLKESLGPQVNW